MSMNDKGSIRISLVALLAVYALFLAAMLRAGRAVGYKLFDTGPTLLVALADVAGSVIVWACALAALVMAILCFRQRRYALATACLMAVLAGIATPRIGRHLFFKAKDVSRVEYWKGQDVEQLRRDAALLIEKYRPSPQDLDMCVYGTNLPPSFAALGIDCVTLQCEYLSVTTAGLGDHRSGYFILPEGSGWVPEEPKKIVDGVFAWAY